MSRAMTVALAAWCLILFGGTASFAAPSNGYPETSDVWAEAAPVEDGFNLGGVVEHAGFWGLSFPAPNMSEIAFLAIQDNGEASEEATETEVVAIPEPSSLIL